MIIKERQSEGGHWYDREGNPAYSVTAKNGQQRATTLRDARSLDLCPSVSGIIAVAARPSLDIWKQQNVLLAALTLPRKEGEPEKDWLDRVMMDSKQTGRVAADRGTAIHATIQAFFEGALIPESMPMCRPVEEAIKTHFGELLLLPELSFAHPLGYGGKADLIAKSISEGVARKFMNDKQASGPLADILRNTMAETFSKTEFIHDIEEKINSLICPALSKVGFNMDKQLDTLKQKALS